MGNITSKDSKNNLIEAKIDGASVSVRIEKGEEKNSKVTISARKYMIPKKKIAEGVLFELKNNLK